MDNAIIQALRRARQAYMTNVGEPTAQLVGGGVRGYLGLDAPEYADSRGMEAYRNAAAISNTPVVGMPSMAVRAGAKAAPAIAQSLREHAKGFQEYNRALGPAGASQMVVWHGSPHKFDAFDASKIGTGEGAQAYGHGLYLAEGRGTAEHYAKTLPARADTPEFWANKNIPKGLGKAEFDELSLLGQKMMRGNISGTEMARWRELKDIDQATNEAIEAIRPTSNLYKVDLPDEKIARMLDWDKPVADQGVNDLLKKIDWNARSGSTRGKDLYDRMVDVLGGQPQATEQLRQAGIPGIRYLDQGSRSNFRVQNTYKGKPYGEPVSFMTEAQARDYATEQAAKGFGTNILPGTSNFVVFPGEEAALTILERNNEIINALRKRKN